jgi:hypothetical protein
LPAAHDGRWPRVPASTCACTRPRHSGSLTTRHLTHGAADRPPRPRAPSTALLFFYDRSATTAPLSIECHHRVPFVECRRRPRVPPPPRASSASTVSRRAEDRLEATGLLRLRLPLSASTWTSHTCCSPDQLPPPRALHRHHAAPRLLQRLPKPHVRPSAAGQRLQSAVATEKPLR